MQTKTSKASPSEYHWAITDDLVHDGYLIPEDVTGLTGPGDPLYTAAEIGQLKGATPFRMVDNDGEVYFEGVIAGKFTGKEPLLDFGEEYAGATKVLLKRGSVWVEAN